MPLPIVLPAQSARPANVRICQAHQVWDERMPRGAVVYELLDEGGSVVRRDALTFSGEEFNAFWRRYNSGTALYELVAEALGLTPPAPLALEAEFLYTAPPEPPAPEPSPEPELPPAPEPVPEPTPETVP